jgi:hypothetical protein
MRRFFLIVLFILFLVPWRQVMAGTIPDEIKKTVAFVFVKGGDGKLTPNNHLSIWSRHDMSFAKTPGI